VTSRRGTGITVLTSATGQTLREIGIADNVADIGATLSARARDGRRGLSLGRRFTSGGEQLCPRLAVRFDKSGHSECRARLKRLYGRNGS